MIAVIIPAKPTSFPPQEIFFPSTGYKSFLIFAI